MMESVLAKMDEVLSEMDKSNEEMAKMGEAVDSNNDPKEQAVKENVITPPKISGSLTGDEKSRYQAIGKEMFAPILSSLEKLIQNEKKKNDMTITSGGDENTIQEGLNIQYEAIPKEEGGQTTWVDTLMEILGWIAIGAIMFGPKIEEFFTNAWEWIKELFSSIASFFDFSGGPIGSILSIIGGALTGLWKLVTGVFKGLAAVGGWIWDGIKTIFNKFITGPDGIINFGIKLVKGIIDFAKNAITWLGDVIMNAILWPIKAIFGGAEEDGKKAGEEAAKDTTVQANQAVHQQEAAAKAVSDRAIMSQQETEASWRECVKSSRDAAKKRADEVGLRTNADGTISDDSIKTKLAENMLEAFEKENEVKLRDSERQKMIEAMKQEMQVRNGKLDVDGEQMKKAMKNAADKISKSQDWDSGALDALQDLNGKQFNTMQAAMSAGAQQMLDIQGQANVKNEFDAKTAEEQFLYRMEEAKKRGTLAEFRIAEARSMIVKSIAAIKETFGNYDTQLTDNFSAAFRVFVAEVKDSLRINVSPVKFFDHSHNNINTDISTSTSVAYNIMPLSKEDFRMTSNELVSIAERNTDIILNQNAVLGEIKELLANSNNIDGDFKEINDYGEIEPEDKKEEKSIMSDIASTLQTSLLKASTSWFD